MEIIMVRRAGFCFGVKRAVDIAFKVAHDESPAVTLGPIIHNPQVIEKLREKGVDTVDTVPDNNSIIIIANHLFFIWFTIMILCICFNLNSLSGPFYHI